LVYAGGSILGALTGSVAGDLDIFLKCKPEDAGDILKQIYAAVQRNQKKGSKKRLLVTRSRNCVSFYRVGDHRLVCPPVQVVTAVLDGVLPQLLDFDIDSACFAYIQDESRVVTTPRGMRALTTGVNVLDTRHFSPCYWKRLEKYAYRGFAIAVPGLVNDKISKALLNGSYIQIPKTGMVFCLGDTFPGKEVDIADPSSPLRVQKVRAAQVQDATLVSGLARLIVLDRGLARQVDTPVAWKNYKNRKVVAKSAALTGACVPLRTGKHGRYQLLWGVDVPNAVVKEMDTEEASDAETEASDAEYNATPLADVYNLLERIWRHDAVINASQDDEGLFQGGVMERIRNSMSSAHAASTEALETHTSRASMGKPLLFVWDLVVDTAPYERLRYVLDCGRSPLQEKRDFAHYYGLSRCLEFTMRKNRAPASVDIFSGVY